MHPGAVLSHLEYTRSDHRPILLDTEYQSLPGNNNSGTKRFEGKWLKEEGFREEVQRAWEAAGHATSNEVLSKLNHMHQALHAWDSKVLKKPKRRLRKAQREYNNAMTGPISDESEKKAKESANLIEILLEQEEVHWLQRSRANWLQSGDRNTSFFHNYASARRKKFFIKKLKNNDGAWVEGTAPLKPLIYDYFVNLFNSEVQVTDEALLEKIQAKVTQDMNDKLLNPFTAEDVRKAVFSIGDYKAPGSDGLHAVFYKKFWSVCGEEITQEILNALNIGEIPEGWNDTTAVLIPKVDDLELVAQFRPISLCNVIYKIISKMLSMRLKDILPEVISPMQSAFVPGHLITDNVLVAYECVHSIKNKRSGSTGYRAVKLDMHKAYDRVE
jgi:hypothetical protein